MVTAVAERRVEVVEPQETEIERAWQKLVIVLDYINPADHIAREILSGELGKLVRAPLTAWGVDLNDTEHVKILYVIDDVNLIDQRKTIWHEYAGKVQQELFDFKATHVLACGPIATAACLNMSRLPPIERRRGRAYDIQWLEDDAENPPRPEDIIHAAIVVPTYNLQQVWKVTELFRDVCRDMYKIIHSKKALPLPKIRTFVPKTVEEMDAFFAKTANAKVISCDLETMGFNYMHDLIESIGFGALHAPGSEYDGTTMAIPYDLLYTDREKEQRNPVVASHIKEFLSSRSQFKGALVFHNGQFDFKFLRRYTGVWPDHPGLIDTLLMNYALDERPIGAYFIHGLKDITRMRYDAPDFKIDFSIWEKTPIAERNYQKLYEYQAIDCFYTAKLYTDLQAEMDQEPELWDLVRNIYMPGTMTLAQIEMNGIMVDRPYFEELERKTLESLAEDAKVLADFAAQHGIEDFKPSSSRQLSAMIYDVIGAEQKERHKKGSASEKRTRATDKITLGEISRELPEGPGRDFVEHVIEYRRKKVVLKTFIRGLLDKADPADDRVHAQFKIAGTVTGRLSCIAKGTPIDIVRDLSQYPVGIPIENVKVGDLAYTYDEQGHLTIRKVLWMGKTGHKKVVRVHWKSASAASHRAGYLDLTPDHKVRLIAPGYTWCEAAKLQPGDHVYAMSRRISDKGYAHLATVNRALDQPSSEHRFIYKALHGAVVGDVHHDDENILNNLPSNLILKTPAEHKALHVERRWIAAGKEILSKEWMEGILRESGGKPTVFRDEFGYDYNTAIRYLDKFGIDWEMIEREVRGVSMERDAAAVERLLIKNRGRLVATRRDLGVDYYVLKSLIEEFGIDYLAIRVACDNNDTDFAKLAPENLVEILYKFNGQMSLAAAHLDIDYDDFRHLLAKHGIDWRPIRDECNRRPEAILRGKYGDGVRPSKEIVLQTLEKNGWRIQECARELKMRNGTFKELCAFYKIDLPDMRGRFNPRSTAVPGNHVITKIEYLDEEVDVYDLTIEETHNFIAAEINVKNCSEPNLQNIPTIMGSFIRTGFIAKPGYKFVEIDYSQLELRMAAWFSNDESLFDIFKKGQDFHKVAATRLFNKPLEEVEYVERLLAKHMIFGLLYGRGAASLFEGKEMDFLARTQGRRWTRQEAEKFIRDFMDSMPTLRDWMNKQKSDAVRAHEIVTPIGRKRRFPAVLYHNRAEIERQAVNTPLQATASDLCFTAAIRLQKRFRDHPHIKLLSIVHDAIYAEVREDLVDEYMKIARYEMEENIPIANLLPFKTSAHATRCWGEDEEH